MRTLQPPRRPIQHYLYDSIAGEHPSIELCLLSVERLYAGYRDADVLTGISMHVNSGEIVCIIGPNGAGKSTFFKALYGFLTVRSGLVLFEDQDITHARPQELLQAGITMVPQARSLFPQMTVYENLEMGMFLQPDPNEIRKRIDDIFDLFPRLRERARQTTGTMSGGEQRMLEIARALMVRPKLLLMDEPSAGLAPLITRAVFKQVLQLNRELGLTVLMVEKNARQGLEISDRGYVLVLGRKTFEGSGQELINNPAVRRSFLGLR